ncbi:HIT family protein [Kitasatospora camelliae]|uniref:Diadenosine tetraphosphate (Ap4A) HIT family hydrolase n=1 Tax=Kitasatospora camelliae TaxID=3156397 RepID=A0AAU8K894_9ACTN
MIDENGTTSPYVARLPIGERIPLPEDGIPFWEVFPYEGDLRIKVLERPELPEPPRDGEDGPETCKECAREDADFLWTDDRWRLAGLGGPTALPTMLLLEPRAHHDLTDLPADLAAELGPMLQRVERAVLSLGGVGRVHVNRWGDGSAHLHLWLIARPEGMMQLRGTCLPLWDDVLPKAPVEEWRETNRRIAAAMAADGGTAHL